MNQNNRKQAPSGSPAPARTNPNQGRNGAPNPANRPPRRRKPKYNYPALFMLIVAAVVVLIIFIVIVKAAVSAVAGKAETTTAPESATDAPVSEESVSETEPPADKYDYISLGEADLHTGDLLLVNYEHAYVQPDSFKVTSLYGNKNSSYKLSGVAISVTDPMLMALNSMLAAFDAATGKHDIIITSGYRTVEEQQAIMDERIENYGEELAKLFVAQPGYSEHHTGLAVDMAVFTDNNEGMNIDDDEVYSWIAQNCHKYGIIRRFIEDKTEITQISNEPWHFRYVGKPHAYVMEQQKLCLEEYIGYLKSYTVSNRLSVTDDEGALWEIYYVPSGGDATAVPVPQGTSPVISGNNVDGFIVTISLTK